MVAAGDTLWYTGCNGAGAGSRIKKSTDGGLTWTSVYLGTTGTFVPYVALNSLQSQYAYVQGRGSTNVDLGVVDVARIDVSAMTMTVLQDALDLGVQNPQWIWFSQVSTGYQRLVKRNIIYTTLDGWTSVETVPAAKSENVDVILAPAGFNENWLILGARTLATEQNHVIYTSVGDAGALGGKAGSDPVGGTDSIPRTAGGVALSGIEVVG